MYDVPLLAQYRKTNFGPKMVLILLTTIWAAVSHDVELAAPSS